MSGWIDQLHQDARDLVEPLMGFEHLEGLTSDDLRPLIEQFLEGGA